MIRKRIFTIVVLLGLFVNGLFVSEAFAYLDPATGSLIIQVIIGTLAGIGITLKIYWHRIKEKLTNIKKQNED